MSIPDGKAFVNLVDFMGGDLAVANSARVSYRKSSVEMNERDERLIKTLMVNKHGTPFEQAVFTFYVKCPIFVAREWFRHRMGSFNEVSGRYTKMDTEYYTPKTFRVPVEGKKQMEYQYENSNDVTNLAARKAVNDVYDFITSTYNYLVNPVEEEGVEKPATGWGLGIAKEHARIILPLGIYTEFRWTVNARALMNFLSLRNHPTAMTEIRVYAMSIEQIFKVQMPVTYQSYIAAKRVAP